MQEPSLDIKCFLCNLHGACNSAIKPVLPHFVWHIKVDVTSLHCFQPANVPSHMATAAANVGVIGMTPLQPSKNFADSHHQQPRSTDPACAIQHQWLNSKKVLIKGGQQQIWHQSLNSLSPQLNMGFCWKLMDEAGNLLLDSFGLVFLSTKNLHPWTAAKWQWVMTTNNINIGASHEQWQAVEVLGLSKCCVCDQCMWVNVSGTEEKSRFVTQLDLHEMRISTLALDCVTNHRLLGKKTRNAWNEKGFVKQSLLWHAILMPLLTIKSSDEWDQNQWFIKNTFETTSNLLQSMPCAWQEFMEWQVHVFVAQAHSG